MAEPWLSADDAAAYLGVTIDTVYTWITEKAMPAHKVGRLWKFPSHRDRRLGPPWLCGRIRRHMSTQMSDAPAEMRSAMESITEQSRNVALWTSDAICVSGRRTTER